jgi:8-oxo-dGTP pyrophosphatase MutT (NUDIX family)
MPPAGTGRGRRRPGPQGGIGYAAAVPIPQFVLDLRARLGHEPLHLPGVTAVVFDDVKRVLLVQRADNLRWTLVTGCLDPGEQPAVGAVREVAEETAVQVQVERLLSVTALPLMTFPNGDQTYWMDVAFHCHATGGQARVNDDESVDVGWFRLDELPDIPDRHRQAIDDALDQGRPARFLTR